MAAGAGVVVGSEARYVTHIDVAPTLLDLALADFDDADGVSLVPLLQGSAPSTWRTDFLVEFNGTYVGGLPVLHTKDDVETALANGDPMRVPTYRALRDEEWLYVEWYAGAEHDYELYDLATDPYQLTNLVATAQGASDHAATTTALQARLDELAVCAGRTCRN